MIDSQLPAIPATPASPPLAQTGSDAHWRDAWRRAAPRQDHFATDRQAHAPHDAPNEEPRDDRCFQGLLAGLGPAPQGMGVANESALTADTLMPSATPGQRADGGNEAQPLRMHAEWTAAGVRLWIGVSLAGQPLASLLSSSLPGNNLLGNSLRRGLERNGVRLASLVCNGRTLYTLDAETAAKPASATDVARPHYPPNRGEH